MNNNKTIRGESYNRIWELDFFRGIALLFMVYFHIIFDLRSIYGFNVSYSSGINFYIGKIAVILFMFIAGISSSLSRNNFKRGLKILIIALILSIVTHIFGESYGVKFGVLHFFGVSMLMYPLLTKVNRWALIPLSFAIILIGNYFNKIYVDVLYLFPIGLMNRSFFSSDYYPLFPWLGIFTFGIAFSKFFYKKKVSLLHPEVNNIYINQFLNRFFTAPIVMIGRNTLLIYLLHQPLILLIIYSIRFYL